MTGPGSAESGEERDELGAHVSAAGGVQLAPGRAARLDAGSLQLFTKTPSRWAEPTIDPETARAFREARAEHAIRVAGSHDSYLINLASPDPVLRERSSSCFRGELERSGLLGLDFVVTHPGNATDGDRPAGAVRNAEALARAAAEVPDHPRILLEITAGSGSSVGGSFEALARILDALPAPARARVGVCFDTCHAWAAGYDLLEEYEGVWESFDRILGLDRLGLFHLNDSQHPRGSKKDRHESIGQGTLGPEPFRRIMTDPRFRSVPKVLETPKGDDPVAADLENLGLLRSFRTS